VGVARGNLEDLCAAARALVLPLLAVAGLHLFEPSSCVGVPEVPVRPVQGESIVLVLAVIGDGNSHWYTDCILVGDPALATVVVAPRVQRAHEAAVVVVVSHGQGVLASTRDLAYRDTVFDEPLNRPWLQIFVVCHFIVLELM